MFDSWPKIDRTRLRWWRWWRLKDVRTNYDIKVVFRYKDFNIILSMLYLQFNMDEDIQHIHVIPRSISPLNRFFWFPKEYCRVALYGTVFLWIRCQWGIIAHMKIMYIYNTKIILVRWKVHFSYFPLFLLLRPKEEKEKDMRWRGDKEGRKCTIWK